MKSDLKKVLKEQDNFSNNFYDKNKLNNKEKEELLKTLCLGLQQEVSQIISSTDFKVFDKTETNVDINKILYSSIDAFRYLFAMINLYNISSEEITSAYNEKDIYLNKLLELNEVTHKPGQPVIVVDVDDIIASFRSYFNNWLFEEYNVKIDENSKAYYSSKEMKNAGYSPEGVFESFIDQNEIINIPCIDQLKRFLDEAHNRGYYIQLLTARNENNLKCKYQTYYWLHQHNIKFHSVDFAPEKYIWVAKKDYYINGDLKFAIDDSPKHALEYATHDINIFVPRYAYNDQIDHKNIEFFDIDDAYSFLTNKL